MDTQKFTCVPAPGIGPRALHDTRVACVIRPVIYFLQAPVYFQQTPPQYTHDLERAPTLLHHDHFKDPVIRPILLRTARPKALISRRRRLGMLASM